jgi:DNA invertase Pin-like site-specific DNA recombinase
MVQLMRAALYARVSKEDQVEGYSLHAQKRGFRTLVKGKGWAHSQHNRRLWRLRMP